MASTVWRGHLTFGLVSFPVSLFRAARPEKVNLRRLYRPAAAPPAQRPEPIAAATRLPAPPSIAASYTETPSRASGPEAPQPPSPVRSSAPVSAIPPPPPTVYRTHNTVTAPAEEDPISPQSLVKGYEFDKGRYVLLENSEIQSITPETSKEMQLVEFVRLAEIDPLFFETSYYLVPAEAGVRPYTLLLEALRQSGYVGLAQLAMHRREHVVIIRPGRRGLVVHTMFYPDEVHGDEEYRADTETIVTRELDLARLLIQSLATSFEPDKFHDTYRKRLEELIAAKIAGKQIASQPAQPGTPAPVIDIFAALQESLKLVRKPAAAAETPAPVEQPAARKKRARKAG